MLTLQHILLLLTNLPVLMLLSPQAAIVLRHTSDIILAMCHISSDKTETA
ncbi:MAG: hypothetical protein IPJ13_00850 [Saprospiraceae bacterium]|nr:hypothetical protein [Saprospiraceae bacterium]